MDVKTALDAIEAAVSWDCEPADLSALARILEQSLTRRQVAGLAAAFLGACDNDDALELAEITQEKLCAGEPIPDFMDDINAEAKNWAAIACDAERRCYLSAIWSTMDRPVRIQFLNVARKNERI